MKNIARLSAALAALALAGSLHPAAAKPVTRTASYVGSFDPITFGICKSEGAPENIGKVCFKVPKKKTRALMSMGDAVGDTLGPGAGFFFIFEDRFGDCVGEPDDPTAACPNAEFACGQKEWPIPRSARTLLIYPNQFLGPSVCALDGDEGLIPATAGTITVRFS